MTPLLCRVARAFLNWTQRDLGESSGTSRDTVRYFETKQRVPLPANLAKIHGAFVAAGIWFIEDGDESVTVRLEASNWAAQCRAARSLVGLTHIELAKLSFVSDLTVLRVESEQFTPRRATVLAIQRGLEGAGVIFLADDGCGRGITLRGAR
jgi:transcriptional regulator with XRE-family HTH domain